MLSFNWKFLTPLALGLLVVIALFDRLLKSADVTDMIYMLVMLAINLLTAWVVFMLLNRYARRQRKRVDEPDHAQDEAAIPATRQSSVSNIT